MKKMLTALLAAAVAGALFIAAPLTAAPPGTENYNQNNQVVQGDCDGDDTLTIEAPTALWPPNHKYYEGIVVTATDGDGGEVKLDTTGYHDQWDGDTETSGSGNTLDDIRVAFDETATRLETTSTQWMATETDEGTVITDWIARAERAGRDADKAGRTYTLQATSSSDGTEGCTAEVIFSVPHDMRRSTRFPDEGAEG